MATKTVLLVDDGTLREEIRPALESHGWTILDATTSDAAIESARQTPPDAILLNLEFPVVDGHALATGLKLDPVTCAIPILAAFAPDGPARPGTWAADSVTLPLKPQVLLAKLQRLLVRRQRRQPYVLIADDEPDLIDIMTTTLDRRGFLTSSAFDGFQALELARLSLPDAILLDLDMPRLNGWQVLEQLKQDHALSSIRIVILTGVATSEHERKICLSRGADAYLLKPCSPEEVVRVLQDVLQGA